MLISKGLRVHNYLYQVYFFTRIPDKSRISRSPFRSATRRAPQLGIPNNSGINAPCAARATIGASLGPAHGGSASANHNPPSKTAQIIFRFSVHRMGGNPMFNGGVWPPYSFCQESKICRPRRAAYSPHGLFPICVNRCRLRTNSRLLHSKIKNRKSKILPPQTPSIR